MAWIIPFDKPIFDQEKNIKLCDCIECIQDINMDYGDDVYIYVGEPYNSILYKCCVIMGDTTEIIEAYISRSPLDECDSLSLELVRKYPLGLFSKDIVLQNGINSIKAPGMITEELRNYILLHEVDEVYSQDYLEPKCGHLFVDFRRKNGDYEKHECTIHFSVMSHWDWKDYDDSVSFNLARAAKIRLDEFDEPEDMVGGHIYFKETGDPSLGFDVQRIDNEWVFSRSKEVKFTEITRFYPDGKKEVELIRK